MDYETYALLIYLLVALLGGALGSFINVLAYRWPRDLSVSEPRRSFCPACRHSIAWYDNIPLLSWLLLRGRCRSCAGTIPVRYPLVEGACMLALGLTYWWHVLAPWGPRYDLFSGDAVVLAVRLLFVADLLAILLIDGEHYVIPRALSAPPLWAGLLLAPLLPGELPDRLPLLDTDAAAALGPALVGGLLGLVFTQTLLWLRLLPRSYSIDPALEDRLDQKESRLLAIAEERGLRISRLSEEDWLALEPQLPPELAAVQQPDFRHRREMALEALYLLGPLLGMMLAHWCWSPPEWITRPWCRGLLASGLGILVGGGLHWFVRLTFTVALDRVAMGMGDVRLMAGVGALLGWFPAALAFLLAPALALPFLLVWRLVRLGRQVPFGPWLCLGSFAAMLLGERLWSGESGVGLSVEGLGLLLRGLITGSIEMGATHPLYNRWSLLLAGIGLALFVLAAALLALARWVARRAS